MIDTETWISLHTTIMNANEKECKEALKKELKDQRRKQFALRIFSRMNRLRTVREREEILEVVS